MNQQEEEQNLLRMLREGLREVPPPDVGRRMAADVVAALAAQSSRHRSVDRRTLRPVLQSGLIAAALSLAVTRACIPGLLAAPPIALPPISVGSGGLTGTAIAEQERLPGEAFQVNSFVYATSLFPESAQAAGPVLTLQSPARKSPSGQPAPEPPHMKNHRRGYGMTVPHASGEPQRES
ncbi:MAG: hypothetical protein KGJ62_04270 [Armatimonadetes bacterium]|nr:hypothetical protein [Armatimonadota bacterium]MDE2205697.1 hypothetical protein [Armatimonadota bacterium]